MHINNRGQSDIVTHQTNIWNKSLFTLREALLHQLDFLQQFYLLGYESTCFIWKSIKRYLDWCSCFTKTSVSGCTHLGCLGRCDFFLFYHMKWPSLPKSGSSLKTAYKTVKVDIKCSFTLVMFCCGNAYDNSIGWTCPGCLGWCDTDMINPNLSSICEATVTKPSTAHVVVRCFRCKTSPM